ncbi:hypothetical protein EI94DRAFT_359879 [Lactarius quietus]|nr:hypothetical protein EI94DRAFT_359879 [Lactarius quietus]
MHSTHIPLSCFQMVVTVLLAAISLTSAQATLKLYLPMYPTYQWGGCYNVFVDSDSNPPVRVLNTEASVLGGLNNASVENCIGECKSMGFIAAGLEQQTCWCGSPPGTGTGTQLDISHCNSPCTGDLKEYCGGDGALLLYFDFDPK